MRLFFVDLIHKNYLNGNIDYEKAFYLFTSVLSHRIGFFMRNWP